MSTREELIAAIRATATQAPRAVVVPKWGTVYVRDITVGEVEEHTADTENKTDKAKFARAVARVLCDETGTLLFDANDNEHVALLAKQPWKLLRKILEEDDSGN